MKRDKHYPGRERIWLDRSMFESQAYRELTSAEKDVLIIFLCMRRFKPQKNRRTRKTDYVLVNDGQIVFTYTMAQNWGIRLCTFARAIDHLLFLGFIEIAHVSCGYKDPTLFGYSDRWRKYGTPEHVPAYRDKKNNAVGLAHRFKTNPQK